VLRPPLDAGLRYRPRVRAGAREDEIVAHFRRRFDLDVARVDPLTGRTVAVGARAVMWPEAQRLDQLLRQVPVRFVRRNPGLQGLVLVDRSTIGRKGGYRPETRRIVVYRPGQSLVQPDEDVPGFSVFVATVAHELGEAAWDTVVNEAQRVRYATTIAPREHPRVSEEFADLVMLGLLAPHLVALLAERAFLRELGLRL
jgi:hypothetical protein